MNNHYNDPDQPVGMHLAELYRDRKRAQMQKNVHARELAATKIKATPIDIKALGSNDTERKLSLERIIASDPSVQDAENSVFLYEQDLLSINEEIEALEAIRRDQETRVYARMAEALTGIRSRSSNINFTSASAVRDAGKYPAATVAAEEIASQTEDIQTIVNDSAGEQVEMIPGDNPGSPNSSPAANLAASDDIPF
jgi:hypothetical protein